MEFYWQNFKNSKGRCDKGDRVGVLMMISNSLPPPKKKKKSYKRNTQLTGLLQIVTINTVI